MKHIHKYIIVALVGLISAPSAVAVELAATKTIQDASSKIESSHDALLNIKDSAVITDAEKEEKGIIARKNIIRDAISLALIEIENVTLGLSKLPAFEAETIEAKLKAQFINELALYSAYYKEKSIALEKNLSVEEVKALAKEIFDYRANIYNPAIEKMGEFSLIFYTEETITTANLRLAKMLADLNKLDKLNIYKISSIQRELDNASVLLKSSDEKYREAKNLIFAEPSPALETAVEIEVEEVTVETIDATDKEITIEAKPTVRKLIEGSLTDIKSTYDIFIKISQSVRKSLGLR